MKTVEKVERKLPVLPTKKRVAAYARVSFESERMQHSLSAQVSYYSELIQRNPEWEYAGVFADYGVSGTSTRNRTQFNLMLEECEKGNINIILTKSIQRFARNTVDLLNTVRQLKKLGIEVRFEKERINSLSGDGELMLSILASFAQEESRSISENCRWAAVKKFKQGIPNGARAAYGYEWKEKQLIIVPKEAEIVKRIYKEFMTGEPRIKIAEELNEEQIFTKLGYPWRDGSIRYVLENIIYTGNMLFQKYYSDGPGTPFKINEGQLPQYYVENTHEAIIPMDEWKAVQKESASRCDLGVFRNKNQNFFCFTSKIKCPFCGCSYTHTYKTKKDGRMGFWRCYTTTTKKVGDGCPVGGSINDYTLKRVCAEVLNLAEFDENVFLDKVDRIEIPQRGLLRFFFKDGTMAEKNSPNIIIQNGLEKILQPNKAKKEEK